MVYREQIALLTADVARAAVMRHVTTTREPVPLVTQPTAVIGVVITITLTFSDIKAGVDMSRSVGTLRMPS